MSIFPILQNKQNFTPILPKPFKEEQQQQPPQKIDVEPFTSDRLLPTRHKTKNAILSILSQGEVVIEFIKFKSKYNEHRVVDVCRISKDGLRIVIYQPDAGRYVSYTPLTHHTNSFKIIFLFSIYAFCFPLVG